MLKSKSLNFPSQVSLMKIAYFYNKLANYLPSFLSRYYIQFLLISIPWILQNSKISLTYISWTFSLFFMGSFISAIIFSIFIDRRRVSFLMKISIVIQIITIILCFIQLNLYILLILRFIQGAASGIFRPLNRIWLQNTIAKNSTPHENTRIASIGQAFIALGMSSGAVAGIGAINYINNKIFVGLIIILPAIFSMLPLIKGTCVENKADKTNYFKLKELIKFFKVKKSSLLVLLIYILSLVIFKIWIIGVPYYFRANIPHYIYLIKISLILQALAYAVAQFIFGVFSKKFSTNKDFQIYLMLTACVFQGIITWFTLHIKSAALLYFLFIVGGGIIPALIFPAMMIILMQDLHQENSNLRDLIFFVLAIAADVGQLLGSACLIIPNVFHITLGIIFIPVLICIFLALYIKMCAISFNQQK